MNPPEILIVADYENLSAYLVLPDDLPEIVEHIDYQQDSQTSVPLVDWKLGNEAYRVIAENISGILARYQPAAWGLACPPMLARKLTERLHRDQQATLGILRQMDVEHVDISNVMQAFNATAPAYNSVKESC